MIGFRWSTSGPPPGAQARLELNQCDPSNSNITIPYQGDYPVTNIMVATDGSGGANRAVDVAAQFAKAFACDLVIVTVANHLLGEEMRQLPRAYPVGDLLEAFAARTLNDAEARARHLGISKVQVRIVWGDVTKCLIDMAAASSTRMIVVGRRGRGQLEGLLLGSVCQKLVSLAPCTVVVVP